MPLIFQEKLDNAQLLVWKIEEEIGYFEERLPQTVAYDKTYEQRTTDKRRFEFLVPRLLIKEWLNEEKTVYYTPLGQPYLENISLSISHSGPFIALLIGNREQSVAVDIERPSNKILRVIDKFLSPEEQQTEVQDPIRYYTLCWSAKETLFKYLPRPAIDFREHLHLSPFALTQSGTIHAHQSHDELVKKELQIRFYSFEQWLLTALIE